MYIYIYIYSYHTSYIISYHILFYSILLYYIILYHIVLYYVISYCIIYTTTGPLEAHPPRESEMCAGKLLARYHMLHAALKLCLPQIPKSSMSNSKGTLAKGHLCAYPSNTITYGIIQQLYDNLKLCDNIVTTYNINNIIIILVYLYTHINCCKPPLKAITS